MRRCLLLMLIATGACSKGSEADLPYISQARSLAAEWALVNRLAPEGKLTGAYVSSMRAELREQAGTAAKGLTQPDSAYGREMQALANEPEDAPPAQLKAHADRIKQIEDSLESA